MPTIAAIWLPVLLLTSDQRGESHKDDSIAGNKGWVWCRWSLLHSNICYCIWTPVLTLHYWAVPVRGELNGLKRCFVQRPTQAKPLQCLRAASLEGIWDVTVLLPFSDCPRHPTAEVLCTDEWGCTPAGSAQNKGQQMMNQDLQSTHEQMCLAGLDILWSWSFASCSLRCPRDTRVQSLAAGP